jgi:hemerythrin HHE cation binding domain-containing protein
MDALGLVRQDHRRLEALLERCERTDHDDPEERTVLLAQLNAALRHHVDEEEALLYPAFPQPDNDLLARGAEQHHRITTLAQELTTIPPNVDTFQPKLRVLADQIRTHLDTEDATLLTALEALLDDPTLLDLGRRLEDRRHVVAAQEALRTTTTNLLPRPRRRVMVVLAATATLAAITFARTRRRKGKGR